MTDTITLPRAEAQKILEALEMWTDETPRCDLGVLDKKINAAISIASAALAQQAEPAKEESHGCACRWDADDNRVATCVRHQGWLDVVQEWSGRARDAEAPQVAQQAEQVPFAWARPDAVDASQDFRFVKIDDFTVPLFTAAPKGWA